MSKYRWNGMTRDQVHGTVRKRLWASARARSRVRPAAYNVRCLEAAARDRADYAVTRNPFFIKMHGVMLETRRTILEVPRAGH